MTENKTGFLSLLNTLAGSGIFLLPAAAARAGSGGYLIPLLALPVLMYAFLFLYHISLLKVPRAAASAVRAVYALICAFLAACALSLASALCTQLMLPGVNPLFLLAALCAVLYLCIASRHTVNGLNLMFFIFLAILLLLLPLGLSGARAERLAPRLNGSAAVFAAILPFFSGMATVPALAAQGADKRSLSLAVCLACLLYAGITAVCISVLGPATAEQGSYAVLITLKSGTALLSLRMLLASLAFSLTLLKPAVNLANSALFAARRLTDGKWLRPVLCAAIFALSLCMRGMISALL